MLTGPRRQDGSTVVTAILVIAIMIPLGLALLAIVDTQAGESGSERTRDRAFNLADSALHSAAFSLSRSAWPASGTSAPNNSGPVGAPDVCASASFGAQLGAETNDGSTTARLQPNLNASYEDPAYDGASWQINVCDDDPAGAGPTVWNDALLGGANYDANGDERVWVRSEAAVDGRRRVLAALVSVAEEPAFDSRYGLIAGRLNDELVNTAGAVLTGGLLGELSKALLGADPLVAPDPSAITTPPSSGVTAVRCGALEGCLTGALGGLSSAVPPLSTVITGGKLVQSTAPTAASEASIAQLKQQAIASGTYVASTNGTQTSSNPPACTIPAGANSDTVVYIEQVGPGTINAAGGAGDHFCVLDVSANVSFKALVIGAGRVVLRGDNTTNGGTVNTFRGLVYALNEQRSVLGDAATPAREIIRIDRGARVVGGVAADGKSARVGIYPPPLCISVFVLGIDVGCSLTALSTILGVLNDYNPAIRSDVSVMNAIKTYGAAAVVPGTYRDILGEIR